MGNHNGLNKKNTKICFTYCCLSPLGFSELFYIALIYYVQLNKGMQRMVIKQFRNAVQQELTYISDLCPLLGLVHSLVLGHLHGNFQVKLHLY